IILLSRQAGLQPELFRPDRIIREPVDEGIDGQVAGHIPVVAVAILAAQRMQMQDMPDQVFQERLAFNGVVPLEQGRIDGEGWHAVANGDADGMRGGAVLGTAEIEEEVAVKWLFPQEADDGVLEDV